MHGNKRVPEGEKIMDKPELLLNPDFTKVIQLCNDYIIALNEGEETVDSDFPHYIYEEALEACFGKNIWGWINERL